MCGGFASCVGCPLPKRLWEKNNHQGAEEICAVAVAAFGIGDAASVRAVQDWFAHRRLQQFAKAEEHLKRRRGMVTARVKGEMERLLYQARGFLGMNGQCTVPNLKQLRTYSDLSASGPKVELMQHVFNHIDSLRTYMGLPMDIASVPEEPMAEDPEGEDEDKYTSLSLPLHEVSVIGTI